MRISQDFLFSVILPKCHVLPCFSRNAVTFAFFNKNVLFLISILEGYRVILTQEYLVLPLLPKSLCFVTFQLNM